MSGIQTYQDLQVWKEAHALVLVVYRLTEKLPKYELYGLISQLRRAALSVAANVVEGFHRRTVVESLRFYNISDASLEEVRYELLVSHDLGYCSKEEYDALIERVERVSKMLRRWIASQREHVHRA